MGKYAKDPHELYVKVCEKYNLKCEPRYVPVKMRAPSEMKSQLDNGEEISLEPNAVIKEYIERITKIYKKKREASRLEKAINTMKTQYANNPHDLYVKICEKYGMEPESEINLETEIKFNKESPKSSELQGQKIVQPDWEIYLLNVSPKGGISSSKENLNDQGVKGTEEPATTLQLKKVESTLLEENAKTEHTDTAQPQTGQTKELADESKEADKKLENVETPKIKTWS